MTTASDIAALLRADLQGLPVQEKKMFGGICFLWQGNMVAGSMKASALFRVGKPSDATALAIPGTYPMVQRDKPMAGFVELPAALCADDARRGALMAMALAFAKSLPPK